MGVVVVEDGARRRSRAKGPPFPGGDSVVGENTLLTSIVPLPVEYERDPYMPRYVLDRRIPDTAVMVYTGSSQEEPHSSAITYSDWPVWLRRWRAKVYVLGILLTMLSGVTDFADTHLLGQGAAGEVLTHRLLIPFVFGLYVGMKEVHLWGWWRLHIVGLLAGILTGLFSYAGWVYLFGSAPEPMEGSARPIDWSRILVDVLLTYVLSTWLVFVSSVLLGKVVQQKAEQERWGAQNVADASVQQGQATRTLSARTTTLLGLFGVLAAALMQSIATVLAAIFGGD